MEMGYLVSRWLHIGAGAVALLTFWMPWVVTKGSLLHRRVGWVYVVAMAVIAISGLALCAERLRDANPANDKFALFLCFIALLAASTSSMGVRALRTKSRTAPSRNAWDVGLAVALTAAGGLIILSGIRHGIPTFMIFGGIGVATGAGQLWFLLRAPATRTEYLLQHIGAMGGSCIATVTAFLVVNAGNLGVSAISVVVWVSPGIVGTVAIVLWQRHYKRKFEHAAARRQRPVRHRPDADAGIAPAR